MSPKYAFSLATSGGLNVDWALGKYCIGAMITDLEKGINCSRTAESESCGQTYIYIYM